MGNNLDVVVITGMHRSGTSLTTSLLQSAGVFIGDRLLGINLSNPKGHFEDLDFVELHQNILQSQGLPSEGWNDNTGKKISQRYIAIAQKLITEREQHSIWGWKDPRTVLFLDFWSQLLPQLKYVFVYRSPWEVVDSLYRRGDPLFLKDPKTAIQTWIDYNQKILHFCQTTSQPWILLRMEDVIDRPQFIINSIEQKLSLNLRSPKNLYDDTLYGKSKVNLYRAQASMVQKYFPQAIGLYQQLHELATLGEIQISDSVRRSPHVFWLWQNWLDRPIIRVKTFRYWSRLKRSIVND